MIESDSMTRSENAKDNKIGVRMYGVSLNLTCDYPELLSYLKGLLPGQTCLPFTSPDLNVMARWMTGPRERGTSFFEDSGKMSALGKRMQIAQDELVWFDTHRDKDLQLRFRKDRNGLVFDVAYCYQPSEKKAAKYPNFLHKKFFDLLRYFVHFPIAWHLERTRGWSLFHASAVAKGDQAVLVAGPGGAGKTTTCVALAAREGWTLLTENLLFSDGANIYPLVEPLRLTDASLALLNNDFKQLNPIEFPSGLRSKSMYWLPEGPALQAARPVALFIPQFASQGFVKPLTSGIAAEQVGAMNRLTLELNDYYWYTAALDLLWPQAGNTQKQLDVLHSLTENTPCYSLGIDRSAGVDPVVEQVLGALEGSVSSMEHVR